MIVVDASVVVPALGPSAARPLAPEYGCKRTQIAAPALLDVEVSSAIRSLERSGEIPIATAQAGWRFWQDAYSEVHA